MWRRILAVIITLSMILGTIITPYRIEASEIDLTKPATISKLEGNGVTATFDNGMITLYRIENNTLIQVSSPSVAGYPVINGSKVTDFANYTCNLESNIVGKLGTGNRMTMVSTSKSKGLIRTHTIETINEVEGGLYSKVTYRSNSGNVAINTFVENEFSLANVVSSIWSYNGGGEGTQSWYDTIQKVTDGFTRTNKQDYTSAAIPISDIYCSNGGITVGDASTTRRQLTTPVVGKNGTATISITWPGKTITAQSEVVAGDSIINVHKGDYYNGLKGFSNSMAKQGFNTLAAEQIPDSSYDLRWESWGWEFDWSLDKIINKLDQLQAMGIKQITLDDGWYNQAFMYNNAYSSPSGTKGGETFTIDGDGSWALYSTKLTNGAASMKQLTDAIHSHGMTAVLWWRPCDGGREGSTLYKTHPEYFVKNADGTFGKLAGPGGYNTFGGTAGYALCPSSQGAIEYYQNFIDTAMVDWGFDGFKSDYVWSMPKCYNTAHNHAYPEESTENQSLFYKTAYEKMISINPNAFHLVCNCGTPIDYYSLPYITQIPTADPTSVDQTRRRVKAYKALAGDYFPVTTDHNSVWYPSTIGTGSVLVEKRAWDAGTSNQNLYEKWANIANTYQLQKGRFIGDLYSYGIDSYETYVIEKDNTMYYAFYNDGSKYPGDGSESVSLKGLDASKIYRIHDYVNNKVIATNVSGAAVTIPTSFSSGAMLVRAIPLDTMDPIGGGETDINYTAVDNTDSSVIYNGTWNEDSNSNFYNNTAKYTSNTDASAIFVFSGSAIRWYGQNDTNFGTADVYIDDILIQNINCQGSMASKVLLFQKEDLVQGEHTLMIVNRSDVIDIDYFEYGVKNVPEIPVDNTIQAPSDFGPVPNQSQLDYYKQELSAFMHFGPNTYTGLEWGNESYTQNSFQASEFHGDEIVSLLKELGYGRLIVTSKHHDGFCLWNSEYTDFDVAGSSYQGDILAELSAACTKYSLDMGLYLSPWDIHEPSYGYGSGGSINDDKNGDYNQFYINQINEINNNDAYGNNGHFVEWWMDGAKGSGEDAQEYTMQAFVDAIRAGNEGVQIFGATDFGGGIHWIGNERGIASDNEWHQKVNSSTGETYWSVPECDVSLTSGWFYHDGYLPKSMEQLATIYFSSVGRGCPLLLNIPPNKSGNYTSTDIARLREFSQAIKDTFDEDLTDKEGVTIIASQTRGDAERYSAQNAIDIGIGADDTYWTMDDGQTTGSLTIDLGEAKLFDVVSIEEYIKKGQRIESFTIEYRNGDTGVWKTFGTGQTIASKRLVRSEAVRADQIRINITAAKAVPLINNVGVYKAGIGFELGKAFPDDLSIIDNTQFTRSGSWVDETINGVNSTGMYSTATNAMASFTFTGTKAWVVGTIDPNHGAMNIEIDGDFVTTVNTYSATRSLKKILYQTDDLSYGVHTVKMTSTTNKALGFDVAYYLDNEAGMFEIANNTYSVNEGDSLTVTVRRIGGSKGEATVRLLTPPGAAVQGQYYEDVNQILTFADGVKEKTVRINTIDNNIKSGDLDFYVEIQNPTAAVLGFISSSMIIIKENEGTQGLEQILSKVADYKEAWYSIGWNEFKEALDNAKLIMTNPIDYTQSQINAAQILLQTKAAALVARVNYTVVDPFVLPIDNVNGKMAEAEHAELVQRVAGEDPNSTNRNVRLVTDVTCSNGAKVAWFENGNAIKLPFYAKLAGTYTVTMRYQSGRTAPNLNKMNWNGTNIVSGSIDVPGGGSAAPLMNMTFDIKVTKAGAGEIIFTADASSSPNIDQFTFIGKNLIVPQYTIVTVAGENGTISPSGNITLEEGRSQTFTFAPKEGYEIADVKLDDKSLGKRLTYTVESTKNIKLEVLFTKIVTNPIPEPESPGTDTPDTDTPGTQNPGTQNPGTVTPGTTSVTQTKADNQTQVEKSGWISDGKDKYYYEEGKIVKSQWLTTKVGNKYYFGNDGKMLKSKWLTTKAGNKYYFRSNGRMMKSRWLTTKAGNKYYFGSNGRMVKSRWITTKAGNKYYFEKNGRLIKLPQ